MREESRDMSHKKPMSSNSLLSSALRASNIRASAAFTIHL
jgi:hypothetical protein